ncbi:hypothetical protein ACQ4PT_066957 [Festuca glaucescens]
MEIIEWICIILSTTSSKLLLNSVPGRPILHRHGLRQGDPVSPMLFLLFMEVLNAAPRRAEALGVLSPLPCQGMRFRTFMYGDDVVIFVAPEARDLSFLRLLLESLDGATGLRTNFDKCSISPIRCSDDHLAVAALHFPRGVKPFPCTYLGLPLSYKRLPRASLQPIVDTICHRLAPGNAAFYTSAGHLVLIKSVITSIPIYLSIAMELTAWLLQFLEKLLQFFLEGIGGGLGRALPCCLGSGLPAGGVWRARRSEPQAAWVCPTCSLAVAAKDTTGLLDRPPSPG